jgi:hypothetical protein
VSNTDSWNLITLKVIEMENNVVETNQKNNSKEVYPKVS